MSNREAIRETYTRQIARFEAELADCTDDERRAVLEENLAIERALLKTLDER